MYCDFFFSNEIFYVTIFFFSEFSNLAKSQNKEKYNNSKRAFIVFPFPYFIAALYISAYLYYFVGRNNYSLSFALHIYSLMWKLKKWLSFFLKMKNGLPQILQFSKIIYAASTAFHQASTHFSWRCCCWLL